MGVKITYLTPTHLKIYFGIKGWGQCSIGTLRESTLFLFYLETMDDDDIFNGGTQSPR